MSDIDREVINWAKIEELINRLCVLERKMFELEQKQMEIKDA